MKSYKITLRSCYTTWFKFSHLMCSRQDINCYYFQIRDPGICTQVRKMKKSFISTDTRTAGTGKQDKNDATYKTEHRTMKNKNRQNNRELNGKYYRTDQWQDGWGESGVFKLLNPAATKQQRCVLTWAASRRHADVISISISWFLSLRLKKLKKWFSWLPTKRSRSGLVIYPGWGNKHFLL